MEFVAVSDTRLSTKKVLLSKDDDTKTNCSIDLGNNAGWRVFMRVSCIFIFLFRWPYNSVNILIILSTYLLLFTNIYFLFLIKSFRLINWISRNMMQMLTEIHQSIFALTFNRQLGGGGNKYKLKAPLII